MMKKSFEKMQLWDSLFTLLLKKHTKLLDFFFWLYFSIATLLSLCSTYLQHSARLISIHSAVKISNEKKNLGRRAHCHFSIKPSEMRTRRPYLFAQSRSALRTIRANLHSINNAHANTP